MKKAKFWKVLSEHKKQIADLSVAEEFVKDSKRNEKLSLVVGDLFLDYSKQLVIPETMSILCAMTKESEVLQKIEDMFQGKTINITEQRAVLHTALRDDSTEPLFVDGVDIRGQIHDVLARVKHCVEAVQDGGWLGFSQKPIKAVVNIGIGGSDLGPAMATYALTPYSSSQLKHYFVSNIDGTDIADTLRSLDPETTIFIIASKTFTTQETLCNAKVAKDWLLNTADNPSEAILRHFIAVTAKPERALEFGIAKDNIYPFWDWVGGRFSLWSAIGLSIAIAIGMDNFKQFLAGACAMDKHFRHASCEQNMPIILAMLGIWNIDFNQFNAQAVIPYEQYLQLLPSYLQQLEMESNGKRVKTNGELVDCNTAPIIWGSVGTNGQHAFHQLLMQGTQKVPVDFIAALQSHNPVGEHHLLLMANCFAQSRALMCGKNENEVMRELLAQGLSLEQAKSLAPHKVIPGNVPSNTILMSKLTPFNLGALLALYEHKVFVQGIIWQINSFDQWGVELGKQLAGTIAPKLRDSHADISNLDASTRGLIERYRVS